MCCNKLFRSDSSLCDDKISELSTFSVRPFKQGFKETDNVRRHWAGHIDSTHMSRSDGRSCTRMREHSRSMSRGTRYHEGLVRKAYAGGKGSERIRV